MGITVSDNTLIEGVFVDCQENHGDAYVDTVNMTTPEKYKKYVGTWGSSIRDDSSTPKIETYFGVSVETYDGHHAIVRFYLDHSFYNEEQNEWNASYYGCYYMNNGHGIIDGNVITYTYPSDGYIYSPGNGKIVFQGSDIYWTNTTDSTGVTMDSELLSKTDDQACTGFGGA